MKSRRHHVKAKGNHNPMRPLYIGSAIILIVLVASLYYFGIPSTKSGSENFQIYGTTYSMTYKSCSNPTLSASSNVLEVCTAILNISSIDNSLPYYFILNKYSFINNTDAYTFLNNISSDLNTSPWYHNIPNTSYSNNLVYTTVMYPDYKDTFTYAAVLALYMQLNNTVISASTSNITYDANVTLMKKYTKYLLLNYESRIEGLK
jgi:hypothetical protein